MRNQTGHSLHKREKSPVIESGLGRGAVDLIISSEDHKRTIGVGSVEENLTIDSNKKFSFGLRRREDNFWRRSITSICKLSYFRLGESSRLYTSSILKIVRSKTSDIFIFKQQNIVDLVRILRCKVVLRF